MMTVLFFIYIALAYAFRVIKFPFLGLDDNIWTLIIAFVYIFLLFLPMILNYQYVSFSDEGDSIVIRYFTTGIIGGRKNSLEIKKSNFAGYRTEKKYFGWSKSIILFQKAGQGMAKYPPVHVSALSRSQLSSLFTTLDNYIPKT